MGIIAAPIAAAHPCAAGRELLTLAKVEDIMFIDDRSIIASRFAKSISEMLGQPPLSKLIQKTNPQEEHKACAKAIRQHLSAFLRNWSRQSKVKVTQDQMLFDWEGNQKRTWSQSHSYPLLGTWAHPDAAVLRPFTCAFEFDRESGVSEFKTALLKTSAHVFSGAYDAAVLVYVLRRDSSAEMYVKDKSEYTKRILQVLETHGLFVAFIPG